MNNFLGLALDEFFLTENMTDVPFEANRVLVWVPLNSPSICEYQKIHFVIVWVPFENFILKYKQQ
jgi:hypothetical protein